jgi:DNA repair exonuclease SbcCD ATPase subunit
MSPEQTTPLELAATEPPDLVSPSAFRSRFEKLRWQETELRSRLDQYKEEMADVDAFLESQPKVADRLEYLCRELFGEILDEVERNLTYALKDVLGQDLVAISTREVQRGKVTISFGIERNGHPEDILIGQGGSVCNVISVGLRLIALSQLDEKQHRRFLVLDEQDCWLRPDLVPRLMSIIYSIAHRLGFQILVISHHDVGQFREYADRIYRILPEMDAGEGARVELVE